MPPVRRSPILLVEDKDSLRTMLRLALEAQEYTVVEARDQSEAEGGALRQQSVDGAVGSPPD